MQKAEIATDCLVGRDCPGDFSVEALLRGSSATTLPKEQRSWAQLGEGTEPHYALSILNGAVEHGLDDLMKMSPTVG